MPFTMKISHALQRAYNVPFSTQSSVLKSSSRSNVCALKFDLNF